VVHQVHGVLVRGTAADATLGRLASLWKELNGTIVLVPLESLLTGDNMPAIGIGVYPALRIMVDCASPAAASSALRNCSKRHIYLLNAHYLGVKTLLALLLKIKDEGILGITLVGCPALPFAPGIQGGMAMRELLDQPVATMPDLVQPMSTTLREAIQAILVRKDVPPRLDAMPEKMKLAHVCHTTSEAISKLAQPNHGRVVLSLGNISSLALDELLGAIYLLAKHPVYLARISASNLGTAFNELETRRRTPTSHYFTHCDVS